MRNLRRVDLAAGLFAVAIVIIAAAGLAPTTVPFDPSTDPSSICTATSPFTNADTIGEPTRHAEASVPTSNPRPIDTAPSYTVTQGDVIQVRIKTIRPGTVAMHGILEEHRLRTDDYTFVRLKAKYSGRFPLHFHGDDGSHFEFAVFQVKMP